MNATILRIGFSVMAAVILAVSGYMIYNQAQVARSGKDVKHLLDMGRQ